MVETKFWMTVKDEACKGALGEYYNRYYFKRGIREVTAYQQHIGRTILSGQDALVQADELLSAWQKDKFMPETICAAAASVLRLCLRHEQPIVEVVENTISVPSGAQSLLIRGNDIAPAQENSSGAVEHGFWPHFHDQLHYAGDRGLAQAAYLPRENYDGLKVDHQGVMAYRGGSTTPALFGLLGGENLIEMPVGPDIRPDYA